MTLPLAAPLVDVETGMISSIWMRAFFTAVDNAMSSQTNGQDTAATFGLFDDVGASTGALAQQIADLQMVGDMPPGATRPDLNALRDEIWLLDAPIVSPKADPWSAYIIVD